MAKGKYAARALRRHEDAEVQAEISGYRQEIKQLTEQTEKATSALSRERAAANARIKALEEQLEQNVSAEVLALRAEVERQRKAMRETEEADARLVKDWDELNASRRSRPILEL